MTIEKKNIDWYSLGKQGFSFGLMVYSASHNAFLALKIEFVQPMAGVAA